MASKVDICNRALLLLGQKAIMSINDDSPRARTCFQEFESAFEATLRSYPWPFAVQRANLARLQETPVFGYKYYYALPADCLKIIELSTSLNNSFVSYTFDSSSFYQSKKAYELEGQKIATDADTVFIKFVALVPPEILDSQTIEVVTLKLASSLAITLIENVELKQLLLSEHNEAMKMARNTYSVEDYPQIPIEGPWLRSR